MNWKNVGKNGDFGFYPGNLYVVAGRPGSDALAIAERESGMGAKGFSAVVLRDGGTPEWRRNIPKMLEMSNATGILLIDAREVAYLDGYSVAEGAREYAVQTKSIVYVVAQMPNIATVDNHMLGDYQQFATGMLIVDKDSS